MRSTAPPYDRVPHPGEGWGVRRAARLAFPDPAARAHDPAYATDLAVYLTDMVSPHGLTLDPGALAPADGQAYDEMARALIERIVLEGEQVDLLVLAYAIPDITPGRSSAVRLSRDCPGVPMAFAVSDQGSAAAFTALRLIRQRASVGEGRRALLIVLEQAWLPYKPHIPAAVPAVHAAVALLFGDEDESADPAERSARLGPVVMRTPAAVSMLPATVGALPGPPHGIAPLESTLILGPMLAARTADLAALPAGRIGSAQQPYTGLWWELADELSRPRAEPRRLVVADYDPGSLTLCVAPIDVGVPAAIPAGQRHSSETT